MRFRPCIDIHEGKVKQIVGSSLRDDAPQGLRTNYSCERSPAFFARRYKNDGLYGGHVIMLGKGNREAAMTALRTFPGGMHAGGGITPDNAGDYIDAGASHVIVTSWMFEESELSLDRCKAMTTAVGQKRLVIDLSCTRKSGHYYIAAKRWQHITSARLNRELFTTLAQFCDEFLVHAIDYEGRQQGIDIELVRLLGTESPIPVTYAGGIRSIEQLEQIRHEGNDRVDATVGSALDLFGGPLSYDAIVAWQNTLSYPLSAPHFSTHSRPNE